MNLYGYAGGDPVNYSDPFGLFEVDFKGEQAAEMRLRWEGMKRAFKVAAEHGNKPAGRVLRDMTDAERSKTVYTFRDNPSIGASKGFGRTDGTVMNVNVSGIRDFPNKRAGDPNASEVMIHEFGHAITNVRFGEEYSGAGLGHSTGNTMENIARRIFGDPDRD